MIYTSILKTDTYIRLSDGDDKVMVIPTSEAILVDDESGILTVKAKGTRKNIAQVKQ